MIPALKPYPAYKDSGLPWLEEIPAHWEVRRIKRLLGEIDRRSTTGHGTLLSMTRSRGLVRYVEVSPKPPSAADFVGYKMCRPNEIVMNRMQAWSGMFARATEGGLVSPDYAVFSARPGANAGFLSELFRIPAMVARFMVESKGIGSGFLRLYTDRFGAIPTVCPPEAEQTAIVEAVATIDRLIRRIILAKRRLIELLNEQKQAIIHRAVNRGIDPAVRLKPSGIDWLGDVPEHWCIRRLKYLVRNVNEQTGSRTDDGVYVALEHIESWTGRLTLPDAAVEFDSQVKRFRVGDILFGKLRPYLAKVTRPSCCGVCVGELLVLRLGSEDVLTDFLEQKLRSSQIINLVNSSTFGAKMPRARWDFIGNVAIAFPPSKVEQQNLLSSIRDNTARLDDAMARDRREIDLIREYRTGLIADLVTGKLDVRALAATLPEINTDEPLDDAVLDEGTGSKDDLDDAVEHAAMSFDE